MPIHEYVCQDCGTQFEKLVRTGDTPECPRCRSVALEKKLSVFATGGGEGAKAAELAAMGPCGSCGNPNGPGSCGFGPH
ncbi:MAG: zinc ribbon domain-containing protein [Betaproteobacteria bacterium]|nr:zinc ribbon domain-containing protein [Betaproteobacteria bacterium]MCC6249555.1 zinc ribbon domain-containing protein [Rubrivivax sp.]MCL4699296.1 zinc ribbon domain-containing protein [Burkholderiaceae bacterium]